jgi:formate hydrogenlyase subunit 3/multisubunit Na+/H+ antiporter MnhD subunit
LTETSAPIVAALLVVAVGEERAAAVFQLVSAGLDCTSAGALAGGLLVWLSSGLAFARLDLTTYHGGYERMPVLAISFLAMGLACTGFPGTLGFIGQELLVDGAGDVFPVMGFAVVIASALTGLAVLRTSGCPHASQPAPRIDAARSMDVCCARDCPRRAGPRTAGAG